MRITTARGAEVCGVSTITFQRVMKSAGVRPVGKIRSQGLGHQLWGVRHVYAAFVLGALTRLNADRTSALQLVRGLDRLSDEQLEAAIDHGRHYVMLAGRLVAPDLFFAENITEATDARAAALRSMGLDITAVDVRPLWDDMRAKLANASEASANVT